MYVYICIGVLAVICIVFIYFQIYRKPRVIRKVRHLRIEEKCRILSGLMEPAGFAYDPSQDLCVSRMDAWQRHYGYCTLFDYTSPLLQMVFDCEPVYFDYENATWLIELWKGQYGINTGCEVGIYKANDIVPLSERKYAHFHSVKDGEMLPINIHFYRRGREIFTLSARHWWLAGFCMGLFSTPEELQMTVSITFPDSHMLQAFTDALSEKDSYEDSLCIDGQTVTLCFDKPTAPQPQRRLKIHCTVSQWKNYLFCRIYRWITRPFSRSVDQLLFLYYFLPFAFRRMITIQKTGRTRKKIS